MSLLTAVAVLAAIGVLFTLDPGGAIAESGFPDFRETDWKQRTAWGFRTIGVVVAQLLIIVLWLWPKWRPPQASPWYSGAAKPGSMPVAAVSALQGHMIWSPTVLASIIEMCQRGTLRIEAVGTRVGFLYRLTRQDPAQYEWERTICNCLPPGPTTVDALRESINEHEDAIGDQIGDFLQQRGLFDDNPVRVRRENSDDGSSWWMVACILTGVGSGLWAALWLDQWWANALIGGFAGLVYSFFALPSGIRTGMLKPTPTGALEISQWLGWEASMVGSAPPGARSQSDPMLAYAVAFNVAQPWLDVAASAPPWFGSRRESSQRGAGLDAAYRAFMHAQEWWLAGRSEDAAKAAAQWGYEQEIVLIEQLDLESPDAGKAPHRGTADEVEEIELDLEAQDGSPAAAPEASPAEYEPHGWEGAAEEEKGGGCLRGCLIWLVALAGMGVLVLVVLFSLDVVSPRDKPCPLDSPPILTPAQIATVGHLLRDECVRVRGTVVFHDAELVLQVDRDEYVQPVSVRDPAEILKDLPPDRVVTLAGRLIVEEDGTYAVHFNTGPRIGPGVVAEPAGERGRAVLGEWWR